jgi:hypothetical protein
VWDDSAFASNRAWWEMQPRFEGDFSALNFLYELKDFKNIAKGITALRPSQLAGSLKRAKATIRRAQRRVQEGTATARMYQTASAATRSIAEGILIKHFAIDPTIKDLMTLHAQMANLVSDVQNRFRQKGVDGTRRHYSENIHDDDARVAAYPGTNIPVYKGLRVKDTFTATMEMHYDYKMRSTTEALKRYYGLEMNAGVAWEATPFSFLLDYFIQVGDAIKRMETDPNVLVKLGQYCESRLVEITSGYTCDDRDLGTRVHAMIVNGKEYRNGQLFSGYAGSLFQRRVCDPRKGLALPRVKLPSVKQAVNIAALVRCFW